MKGRLIQSWALGHILGRFVVVVFFVCLFFVCFFTIVISYFFYFFRLFLSLRFVNMGPNRRKIPKGHLLETLQLLDFLANGPQKTTLWIPES